MPRKYGIEWPANATDLFVESVCYREGRTSEQGGLGKIGHFKRIVSFFWGEKNKRKQFLWHPWAEEMLEAALESNRVWFSGCASSGKTDFSAVWSLVNWVVDPANTLIMQTSTTLTAARRRIWGATAEYWRAMGAMPYGKFLDSTYCIRTVLGDGSLAQRAGIFLIAAEQKKEREAVDKIIGAKNKRVLFVCDEEPDISPAVPSACFSNLTSNPYFHWLGLGNFKSRYDAFGEDIKPKAGWSSININSTRWETKNGIVLRFDGTKSPNILSGKDEWPGIYNSKTLAQHKQDIGETTALFYRMCRSWEAPIGSENTIYSEADLDSGRATDGVLWLEPPTMVSGLDPSYTNGGDRTIQWIAKLGMSAEEKPILQLDKCLIIRENVEIKQPRDYQVVSQFIANCEAHGVRPDHAALDSTGAGSVLYSIICEEWKQGEEKVGHRVLPVNFSGAPSDLIVKVGDTVTAKDQFDRRVSELWWVGKEFMRYQQIRGVTEDLARELTARRYDHRKGPEGVKIVVETKPDMKERVTFSPDIADSFVVVVDLCRQRLGFQAGGVDTGLQAVSTDWAAEVKKMNQVYANVAYGSAA